MGKSDWGGNPVCWWLGLYFCFIYYLDEASCTGCYWWLVDAESCIQVVSFMWVLTIWYSLELVLGEDNGTPLQYSCLENPMARGAWWAAVQRFGCRVGKTGWLAQQHDFLNEGLNLCPPEWKLGVLTTGPPGNSHHFILNQLGLTYITTSLQLILDITEWHLSHSC